MGESRQELLQKILDQYSVWYNVKQYGPESEPLMAAAEFHERETGYMMVRKAEMWSADKHEYTYFFSLGHLDAMKAEACIAKARELGEPLIVPKTGHMCSNIVVVVLCDTADAEAVKIIRSYHYRKSFQFSLKGWMEVHTAVLEVGKASVIANGAGKNTAKFLNSLLHPVARKKKKRFLNIFWD